MAYSVIGGPALGFDLARLPGGPQVADVLRVATHAAPDDLERLAAHHPGAGAREEWRRARATGTDAVEAPPSMVEALPLAGDALHQAATGETTLLRRLEASLLGDVHALDRLLRRELLDWTWLHSGPVAVQDPTASLAADVLSDAAAAAYLRDQLPDDLRRAMAGPFVRASLPTGDDDSGVPCVGSAEVDDRVRVLMGADDPVREAWRRAVDGQRHRTAEWAPAMHQATWALSLSERLRTAFDAQLAGVIAFERAGFTARDAAYGVWNAWSGVLQAASVLDLLPAADAAVLLRPWNQVHPDSR